MVIGGRRMPPIQLIPATRLRASAVLMFTAEVKCGPFTVHLVELSHYDLPLPPAKWSLGDTISAGDCTSDGSPHGDEVRASRRRRAGADQHSVQVHVRVHPYVHV